MAVYSIKDVERLSGIKAHTLRIWEKRYGIIAPKRTDSNIRYFLDEDLNQILDIAFLNKKGYRISKLANMCPAQIKTEIAKYTDALGGEEDAVDALLFAVQDLDHYRFQSILDHHVKIYGLEKTMDQLIYPLLDRIMVMWVAGSLKGVHERFVIGSIRAKLISETKKIFKFIPEDALKFIIYLPQAEDHELSLLYLQYILNSIDIKVLNLGVDVPLMDVIEGNQIFKADCIFTIFNDSFTDDSLKPYIDAMSTNLSDSKIVITGYSAQLEHFELPPHVIKISSILELKKVALDMISKKS